MVTLLKLLSKNPDSVHTVGFFGRDCIVGFSASVELNENPES